jgi:hypothetical protein
LASETLNHHEEPAGKSAGFLFLQLAHGGVNNQVQHGVTASKSELSHIGKIPWSSKCLMNWHKDDSHGKTRLPP